jgi:hypothetical protein
MYTQVQLERAMAKCDQLNEALLTFTKTLYKQDALTEDGRLLIAAPWTKTGWKQYGLLREDSNTMRAILKARQANWTQDKRPILYTYDNTLRSWFLNIYDWPCLEQALFWVCRSGIRVTEFLAFTEVAQEPVGVAGKMPELLAFGLPR